MLFDVVKQRGIFHVRLRIRVRVPSVLRLIRLTSRLAALSLFDRGDKRARYTLVNV